MKAILKNEPEKISNPDKNLTKLNDSTTVDTKTSNLILLSPKQDVKLLLLKIEESIKQEVDIAFKEYIASGYVTQIEYKVPKKALPLSSIWYDKNDLNSLVTIYYRHEALFNDTAVCPRLISCFAYKLYANNKLNNKLVDEDPNGFSRIMFELFNRKWKSKHVSDFNFKVSIPDYRIKYLSKIII